MAADEDKQCMYLGISLIFGIATLLFALSFKALTPLQYGILENTITKTIDKTRVYKNGRYYTGIGNSFVMFGAQAEYIDIPFSGFTADQNPVKGYVSIQYRLRNTKNGELIGIYERFLNTQYQSYFKQTGTEILKQSLNKYRYQEYFTKRMVIEDNIGTQVKQSFEVKGADVIGFQLLEIDFSDSTDQTIVSKMVAGQKTKTTLVQQTSAQVRAETQKIKGFASADIQVITSRATNEASRAATSATANGNQLYLQQQGASSAALKKDLVLSAAQLKVFKFNEGLRERNSKDDLSVNIRNRFH